MGYLFVKVVMYDAAVGDIDKRFKGACPYIIGYAPAL